MPESLVHFECHFPKPRGNESFSNVFHSLHSLFGPASLKLVTSPLRKPFFSAWWENKTKMGCISLIKLKFSTSAKTIGVGSYICVRHLEISLSIKLGVEASVPWSNKNVQTGFVFGKKCTWRVAKLVHSYVEKLCSERIWRCTFRSMALQKIWCRDGQRIWRCTFGSMAFRMVVKVQG